MRLKLVFCVLLVPVFSYAAMYIQHDANGTLIYSDIPLSPNAKQIDVPTRSPQTPQNQTTTSPTTEAAPEIKNADLPQDERKPYTEFDISFPTDQSTFQNQREINVTFKIIPELQKGDMIQLYLDGQAKGQPQTTPQSKLDNIDRGTHQLSATLMDANRLTLKQSKSITFYVHYARQGFPPNKQ